MQCLVLLYLLLMSVTRRMVAAASSIHRVCKEEFWIILAKIINVMSLIRWVNAGWLCSLHVTYHYCGYYLGLKLNYANYSVHD